MGKRLYTNIEIQGMTFATVRDAVPYFGVSANTIRAAIRAGTTHRIGTGQSHPEALPVRIRGVTYPTVKAAAKSIHVTTKAIYQALSANRIDRVGLPTFVENPNNSKPVTFGPVRFRSMSEADRQLGFSANYISKVMRRRQKSGMQRIMAAVMAYAAARENNRDSLYQG